MKKRIALLLAAILLFSCLPWAATPVAAAPAEKSPADGSKILDYVHEDVFEEADHLGRMEEEAFDDTDLGYDIEPINSNMGIVSPGTVLPSASSCTDKRLVAVVFTDEDFHFYMQHSDDTWSHKPGQTLPTTKSLESDVTLTNSNIAACAAEGDYEGGVVGFFYISKSTLDILHGDGTLETYTQVYTNNAGGQ